MAEAMVDVGRRYFSWIEAARYSGLGVNTLRRMVAEKKLHAMRPTGQRRIVLDKLEIDDLMRRSLAAS
jgi:excisionase family DNA binding protein